MPLSRKARADLLWYLVLVVAAIPLGLVVWRVLTDNAGANPIEYTIRFLGDWALRYLLLGLAITPVRKLTGWTAPARFRRMIGVWAFVYVALHLSAYVGLDHFFDWAEIGDDILRRPYITIGMLAFALLIPLAVTSTNAMIRRLGGYAWARLHKLAYPIAVLGVIHYLLLVKADTTQPLIYGSILAALLGYRAVTGGLLPRRRAAA
jgi:sulfoxide reductase heme-binding subunit YedZ